MPRSVEPVRHTRRMLRQQHAQQDTIEQSEGGVTCAAHRSARLSAAQLGMPSYINGSARLPPPPHPRPGRVRPPDPALVHGSGYERIATPAARTAPSAADRRMGRRRTRPGLRPSPESSPAVASFFTLSVAGFVDLPATPSSSAVRPPRPQASPESGYTPTTCPAPLPRASMSPRCRRCCRLNGLELVEIEFLGGWAFEPPDSGGIAPTLAGIEAVAAELGGRRQCGRVQRRHPAGHRGSTKSCGAGVAGQRRPACATGSVGRS